MHNTIQARFKFYLVLSSVGSYICLYEVQLIGLSHCKQKEWLHTQDERNNLTNNLNDEDTFFDTDI